MTCSHLSRGSSKSRNPRRQLGTKSGPNSAGRKRSSIIKIKRTKSVTQITTSTTNAIQGPNPNNDPIARDPNDNDNKDRGGCCARSRVPYEHKFITKVQIRWTKKMRKRRIFMEELKEIRKLEHEDRVESLVKAMGPKWYHTFSGRQMAALDGIVPALIQDRLEGVPWRTRRILTKIGVHPLPHIIDLRSAVYVAESDPGKFFSYLCLSEFNCPFFAVRQSYDLKSRLILSSMYYTGVAEIFKAFKIIFAPDPVPNKKTKKKKKKPSEPEIYESPYLENLKFICPVSKNLNKPERKPKPLPKKLKCINKTKWQNPPTEAEARPPKPTPPPPPPPIRLPREYCDKIAGLNRELAPKFSPLNKYVPPVPLKRGVDIPKLPIVKKVYGLHLFGERGTPRPQKKPKMPKTGIEGTYFHIVGVCQIKSKRYFILGNVCTSRVQGHIIHGGHKATDSGDCILVHEGICAVYPFKPKCEKTCDCLETIGQRAKKFLRKSKCKCGHIYDYKNPGHFHNDDELPYFEKPTPYKPYKFNEDIIYQLSEWKLQIKKEVKDFLEDDSLFHIGPKKKRKKRKVKTQTPQKISRGVQVGANHSEEFEFDDNEVVVVEDSSSVEEEESISPSKTCLGGNPTMKTYIKCAIQYLKETLLVARLPDVYKAPEIVEWMRRRMYGPLTKRQLEFFKQLSIKRFIILRDWEKYGFHTKFRLPAHILGPTTWNNERTLQKKLHAYMNNVYLRKLYGTQTILNNHLWAAMFDPKDPVRDFRECFFAYLPDRPDAMQFVHPYCNEDIMVRNFEIGSKKILCRSKQLKQYLETC